MPTIVDIHPLAIREARLIERYYARVGASVLAQFTVAFDNAVARIGASPRMWSPDAHGTRMCPLRKFPYRLVYIEEPGRVLIVAVPHEHR